MNKKDLTLLVNPAPPSHGRPGLSSSDLCAEYVRRTGRTVRTLTINLPRDLRLRAVPDPAALMGDESDDLILLDPDPQVPAEALLKP
jgi:hypothetical protein